MLAAAVHFLTQPANGPSLAQLQAEVRTALAAGGAGAVTGDAVAQLPYLNAVLEETMRLMPPALLGPRVSAGETVAGAYVPAGVYVSVDYWTLGRDARNAGDDAAVFAPGRWLGDGGRSKPYSQPFSIGPRGCLGVHLAWLEMRVALARVVLAFDWRLAPESVGVDWLGECQVLMMWKKAKLIVEFVPVAG